MMLQPRPSAASVATSGTGGPEMATALLPVRSLNSSAATDWPSPKSKIFTSAASMLPRPMPWMPFGSSNLSPNVSKCGSAMPSSCTGTVNVATVCPSAKSRSPDTAS